MNRVLRTTRRIIVLELAVVLCLVAYYEVGNFTFRAEKDVADENARNLMGLEQDMGIFVENWIQDHIGGIDALQWFLIFVYVGPHFALTLGFLAWAYWYRFDLYPQARDAFAAFTLLAFGFQWILPLSPPRLLPESGLVDSLAHDLPVNGNTPWIERFTNPYAALPSVHFGWSLLVAILAIRFTDNRWRWAWLAYPGIVALATFTTGNHWVLDPALSVAFLGITEGCLWLWRRRALSVPTATPTPARAASDAA
jgi:hypothetical protein